MDTDLKEDVAPTVPLYTPAMMARTLGVPVRAIRMWHRKGLIQPVKVILKIPYFDYSVLAMANTFAHWMQQGVTAQSISQQLVALSRLKGASPQEMAASLPISLEGRKLVLQQGNLRLEASGQLQLSFETDGDGQDLETGEDLEPATIKFASPQAQPPELVDTSILTNLLDEALDAEDREELDEAAQIYRKVLATYGPNADVCFQLAEVLYRQADLGGARERYYTAVELDPCMVEARANLGCVLSEQGHTEAAIVEFQTALEQYPEYADVHFHLARTLDLQGQMAAASQHWRKFVELAPASPWADEAKVRLSEELCLEFDP